MKVGVMTVLFSQMSFEDALAKVVRLGLDAVEIGTGNYPGDAHCKPDVLLSSKKERDRFQSILKEMDLEISAFSCHGNPLHPNSKIAKAHRETFRKTVRLAEKLGVPVVACFSGCPGDSESAKYPNWVTCPWPEDFSRVLEWQWKEKAIPYWKAEATFAKSHGVNIALEMHPGFLVYNPETLLRLREACGENIGANFDPSHLFWQGIDPIAAIRELKGAIFHIHAKDCKVDEINVARHGVLDTKHYSKVLERAWIFRTVGYGHGLSFWCDFVSTLRKTGYDGVLSIEHEDSLMSVSEGLGKAAHFLKGIILREQAGQMWWA